jgi:ribosome-binding protein aMBF1 (putative translation factor)
MYGVLKLMVLGSSLSRSLPNEISLDARSSQSDARLRMDALTTALGRVVSHLRRRRGLSWRALGARSGVSGNTVRNLERGIRSSRINIVARIALGLDIPLWRLVRGAERFRDRRRR